LRASPGSEKEPLVWVFQSPDVGKMCFGDKPQKGFCPEMEKGIKIGG